MSLVTVNTHSYQDDLPYTDWNAAANNLNYLKDNYVSFAPIRKTTPLTVVSTAAAVDVTNAEFVVPADLMETDRLVRFTAWGDMKNNGGTTTYTPIWYIALNTTTPLNSGPPGINNWTANANRMPWRTVIEWMNLGATNSQWLHWSYWQAYATSGASGGWAFYSGNGRGYSTAHTQEMYGAVATAIDTTADVNFKLYAQCAYANANVDVTLDGAVMEII